MSSSVAPSRPEVQRADQQAMGDQVGIAADRRGEVRVLRQVEPEVAEIFVRVARLSLAAQHHLVDQVLVLRTARLREQAVESAAGRLFALGPFQADGRQEVGQPDDLLLRRFLVDAIDLRQAVLLQFLGGADVCLDHELFDQLVSVEAVAQRDRGDLAVLTDAHAALGQVQLQRFARLPGLVDAGPRGPQRLQHIFEQRLRLGVRHCRRSHPAPGDRTASPQTASCREQCGASACGRRR